MIAQFKKLVIHKKPVYLIQRKKCLNKFRIQIQKVVSFIWFRRCLINFAFVVNENDNSFGEENTSSSWLLNQESMARFFTVPGADTILSPLHTRSNWSDISNSGR